MHAKFKDSYAGYRLANKRNITCWSRKPKLSAERVQDVVLVVASLIIAAILYSLY